MGRLIDEMVKEGTLLATERVSAQRARRARVRRAGERFTVTDGPFTEAKELIGGFAIIEAASKDEATLSPSVSSRWPEMVSPRFASSTIDTLRRRAIRGAKTEATSGAR